MCLYHPDSPRIRRAIDCCSGTAIGLQGVAYRSTVPRYANREDILTEHGSRLTGGRWNPPRLFATVYLSLDPRDALEEIVAQGNRFELAELFPRTLVSVDVCLIRIIDLTVGVTRRRLGVSPTTMVTEPWSGFQTRGEEAVTQAIGRLARDSGLEGLIVPSAVSRRGRNLVVFPNNLSPPASWIRIRNPPELPPVFPVG